MSAIPTPVRPDPRRINPRLSVEEYASRVLGPQGRPQPNLLGRGKVQVIDQNRQTARLSAAARPEQKALDPGSIRKAATAMHENRLRALQESRQRSRAGVAGDLGVPGFDRLQRGARGGSGQGYGGAYGLTPNAGAAFMNLSRAYQAQFGQPLVVNSGGRTRQEQAYLYWLYQQGRGNLAAPPGQSVHESGRAVDLGGAAHYSNTPQHAWLRANAGQFGWLWTGKNFSQREDWHWEFQG